MIARFARNAAGRDFVAGDIHGCYDQLQAALARLGFAPGRDRLFAVGDLADRGPLSTAALDWLARPGFHACLGNHDAMLLDAARDPDPLALLNWVAFNGGDWWLRADNATRERFRAAYAALPLALEVETAAGRVGIVHADVPENLTWPVFLRALEAGDPHARETALWGRARYAGQVQAPVAGIDRVVCGHSIGADFKTRVVGNVWLIDTGAFLRHLGGRLTVLALADLFAAPAP